MTVSITETTTLFPWEKHNLQLFNRPVVSYS
jgi:hypothetical protein